MNKINLNLHKIWTVTLMFYIICNGAFSYGDLKMLNTLALYLFLGVSVLIILIKGKVRLDLTIVSLVIYAVLMLVGMLYTPTSANKVTGVVYDYITMLVLTFCVIQYIREVADLENIMLAYMLTGLAMAIYVYAQYGNEFWEILQENAQQEEQNRIERLGGELANVNVISLLTAFSVVIGVYQLIFNRKNLATTIFCVAVVVFCFVISMAGGSKKSLIVIFVSFVAMYFYNALGSKAYLKQFRNLLFMIGGIAAVVMLVTRLPIFSGIVMRYESFFSFMEGGKGGVSDVDRMNLISKGMEVWWNHPLFGAGTYASGHYLGVYAHNNYVELLMNSGLIGLIVFYAVYFVAVIRYISNSIRYKQSGKIAILLFAVLLSVLVTGFAMVYYYDRYCMFMAATACTATGVLGKKDKTLPENTLSNKG
ncbi:MAG: O-antigen ligase family protein [Oscillospiraceae bacterium]|nr:O-antigen ligase family protein [Oscillospiraceae bacterium]